MIPVGRGQRELIIGDRQTGKTAVAIDAIINQKKLMNLMMKRKNFIVFMLRLDKNDLQLLKLLKTLEEAGAMKYTTVVAATASDAAPLQFLAPIQDAQLVNILEIMECMH